MPLSHLKGAPPRINLWGGGILYSAGVGVIGGGVLGQPGYMNITELNPGLPVGFWDILEKARTPRENPPRSDPDLNQIQIEIQI